MASITIIDTGFITPYHSGTQISTANRANSGAKIILKTASFNPSIKSNVDDTPTLAKDLTEVNQGTVENIKFTLSIVLDMTSSTDRGYVYQLVRLCQTKGYKAMFYDVDRSSTENGNLQQVITQFTNLHYNGDGTFSGDSNQGDLSFNLWLGGIEVSAKKLTNVYHLHIKCTEFSMIDSAEKPNLKIGTLTGVITG